MSRRLVWLVAALALVAGSPGAHAAVQDDAGSGGDAGNTFAAATPLPLRGSFSGRLEAGAGDAHDFYAFTLQEGQSFSVSVTPAGLDPVELLDPDGALVDIGVRASSVGVAMSNAFTSDVSVVRVSVHRALVAGAYRLHLRAERSPNQTYRLCVMNCDALLDTPIQLIFGGSLPQTETRVLLVPPAHGDLGNPLGPTVLDYIAATLRGVRRWEGALAAFAVEHPEFNYLREIDVDVEVFDDTDPVDPAGYDVIVGYVAAGPAFRGVASDSEDSVEAILRAVGAWDTVRFSGRVIALSLFGSAPRAGQVMWDFPEVNDLENVTMHEFGHTFGLGHTTTWRADVGPDLMNSPAPFIYGDGSIAGDGGERTPLDCLSSLDLYGMAVLYRWVPDGDWEPSGGWVNLPPSMPYRWYC
jgi:hypothetical protein